MRRSSNTKILTTHVGSLPDIAKAYDTDAQMAAAIADAVAKQRKIGLDVINEGEHTKGGDWLRYIETRLTGFEPQADSGTIINQGRDREVFAEYYANEQKVEVSAAVDARRPRGRRNWLCTGPISYSGQAAMANAIDLCKAQLNPGEEAFLTTTAPGSFEPYRQNQYYKSQEEFLYALADAMRIEYRMIADAGLLVQVDDAWLAALWDRIGIPMGLDAFRKYCALRVEVLNHALSGIPTERIRYHLCWGSWHGPHMFDLPLKDIVDLLLRINAGAYLIEAANPRHEHEFAVWETVKLPEGKILIPGMVSHATPVIEHPELIAYRIDRFTRLVGRENFIAGVDCGLGGRAHRQVGWAKLRALVEGAALASKWKAAA
jgi:5-methyltetrahydropteroyltriglutamate--homocysteine methyltransferase